MPPRLMLASQKTGFTIGFRTIALAIKASFDIHVKAFASTKNSMNPVPRVGSAVMNTPIEKLNAICLSE